MTKWISYDDELKNKIQKLYIDENVCCKDMPKLLNITPKQFSSALYKFNIRKPIEKMHENIEATLIKRYGVKSCFLIKEVKEKAIKNSCTDKAKQKREQTTLERYGVKNIFSLKDENGEYLTLKKQKLNNNGKLAWNTNKQKQTMLNKYGVDHNWKRPEFIKENAERSKARKGIKTGKRKETLKNIDLMKALIEENKNISIGELKDKAGFSTLNANIYPEVRKLLKSKVSYYEKIVENFLIENNIKYIKHDRKVISPLELDFYLYENNVALEINDISTHLNKEKNYHLNKTKLCREKGIRLIHIWEFCLPLKNGYKSSFQKNSWEVIKNCILTSCKKIDNRIYARNTKIIILDAIKTKDFFDKNNINGYRSAKYTYALIDKNKKYVSNEDILMAYSVKKPFFNKDCEIEIVRGASKIGIQVIGGASKIWNEILKTHNSVVYYCDNNYYNANSFMFLKDAVLEAEGVSFWNVHLNEKLIKNRSPKNNSKIKNDKNVKRLYNAGYQKWVYRKGCDKI